MEEYDVISDEFLRNPYPVYARLRHDRPIYWSEQRRAYMLTRYDDVRWAFRTRELNCAHPFRASRQAFGGPTMLDMDGQRHRQLRGLLGPELSPNKVDQFTPTIIRDTVRETIHEFKTQERVDLIASLAARVPLTVMCKLMGLPTTDRDWLEEQLSPMVAFIDHPRNPLASAVSAREKLEEYFNGLIADLDAGNAPVLTRLIGQPGQGKPPGGDSLNPTRSGDSYKNGNHTHSAPPDLATILRTLMLLIAAGSETTIGAIGSTLYCLLSHPEAREQALLNDDVISQIVTETLRWEAPLHSTLRFAAQDFERHGVEIQRGSPIELCIASAGRDETAYPEPETWDPTRVQPELLAFGASGHSCLGRPLAVKEVEIVLEELLESFPAMHLDGDNQPSIVGRTFRRPDHLWVKLNQVQEANV